MSDGGNTEVEASREDEEVIVGNGIPQIAIDLFVSIRKRKRKGRKRVIFTDTFRNIVYQGDFCNDDDKKSKGRCCVLFDPSSGNGIPLISVFRSQDGSWNAFKGNTSDGDHDHGELLLFTVKPTLNTFSKLEFNIHLNNYNSQDGGNLTFVLRGCRFWRSCTVYHHNIILAQTNLMYKLGWRKHFVSRSKFRLTVFTGFSDYHLIAAFILIFLDSRKQ